MPPTAVKTIRDLIFWEYAKLIGASSGIGRTSFGFVMHKFKQLQKEEITWSAILREDLRASQDECVYCGAKENLSLDHIVPKRDCHYDEIHNIVTACKSCNSSKGKKDLIEWYGLENRAKIPRRLSMKIESGGSGAKPLNRNFPLNPWKRSERKQDIICKAAQPRKARGDFAVTY